MASKITKRLVDSASPDPAKDAFSWDSELRGFGLKVTPAGVKVYVLQYHVGTGRNARRRRLVIGRHGSPWTPENARLEAKRLAGDRGWRRSPGTASARAQDDDDRRSVRPVSG